MKSLYLRQDLTRIVAAQTLSRVTKKALLTGISPVVLDDTLPDAPLPGDKWVRVKNLQTGICGSDMTLFSCTADAWNLFEPLNARPRVYLGHETVGVVEEVGAGVTRCKVGDRVSLQRYTPNCAGKEIEPPCRFCAEGDYALCEHYNDPGPRELPETGAGMGDRYLATEDQLYPVSDALSDDRAVLLEPMAVAVHSVLRRCPKPGETVMVYGTGAVGLLTVAVLKLLYPHCRVLVPVRGQKKKTLALRFGGDEVFTGDVYEKVAELTGGRLYKGMVGRTMMGGGVDVIYDTLGRGQNTHDCLRLLRARGSYVKIGYQMNRTRYDETPLWFKELEMIGVSSHGMETVAGHKFSSFQLAEELLLSPKCPPVEELITHRFRLDDYKQAFGLLLSKGSGAIKVVLDCRE